MLPLIQRLVVAIELELLVGKVANRFIVQQTIDSLAIISFLRCQFLVIDEYLPVIDIVETK